MAAERWLGSATKLHDAMSPRRAESSTMRCPKKLHDALSVRNYDYLQEPRAEILASFQDKPVKNQADWQASLACGWPLAEMKDGPSLARMIDHAAGRMLSNNYTQKDVVAYLDFVRSIRVSDPVLFAFWLEWEAVFARVEAETSRSRAEDRFAGANSLGLLKIETRTALERRSGNHRHVPDVSDLFFQKSVK